MIHNALMVSRYNWCHYLFRAYWTRKDQYIPLNDTKKKERTAKLCQFVMKCGPHFFDTKFYILKDEEIEKRWLEDQEKKREERQKRKLEREAAQLKKIEEMKLKMENKAAAEKQAAAIDKSADNTTKSDTAGNTDNKKSETITSILDTLNTNATSTPSEPIEKIKPPIIIEVKQPPKDTKQQDKKAEKTKSDEKQKAKVQQQGEAEEEKEEQSAANNVNKLDEANGLAASTESVNGQPVNTKEKEPIDKSKDQSTPQKSATKKSTATATAKAKKAPTPAASSQPLTAATIMSDPEQVAMITNLNSMAKSDSDLSALMKKVAAGGASSEEINKFQTYIQKAKQMARKSSQKAISIKKEQPKGMTKTEQMRIQQEEARKARQQLKIAREEEKLRIKQEKMLQREKNRQAKLLAKQQSKEQKLKNKLNAAAANAVGSASLSTGSSKASLVSSNGAGEDEDEDIWNDKLTIFQERYATGSQFILEFNENTGARFFWPKDCIYELIDNESDKGEVKQEDSNNGKPKSPYITIKASFLMIHNQSEIDGYERRMNEKRLAAEATEEEKKKKRKRQHSTWTVTKRVTRQHRQAKAYEAERDLEEDYHAEDEILEKERPLEIYSPVTVILLEIPFRYKSLIMESGNTPEVSKRNMELIMKRGKKMEQSWVWNQLDGIKDEILAETLRFNLQRLDYINGGGKLKGRLMLKKLMELGYSDKSK